MLDRARDIDLGTTATNWQCSNCKTQWRNDMRTLNTPYVIMPSPNFGAQMPEPPADGWDWF